MDLPGSGKSFTFIKQPTEITQPDGTKKSIWYGVEKFWENEKMRYGVRTTLFLPRILCVPYGGADESLTDADVEALRKKGGDALHYVVQYHYTREEAYKKRLYWHSHQAEEPFFLH